MNPVSDRIESILERVSSQFADSFAAQSVALPLSPLVDRSPTPFRNRTLSSVSDEIRKVLDQVNVQPAIEFLTQSRVRSALCGDPISAQIAAQVAAFAEKLKSLEDPRCERKPRATTRAHDSLSSAPVTDSATAGLAQLATPSMSCSVAPNVSTRPPIPYTDLRTLVFSSSSQSTTFLPMPISSTVIAPGAQLPPAPTVSDPIATGECGTRSPNPLAPVIESVTAGPAPLAIPSTSCSVPQNVLAPLFVPCPGQCAQTISYLQSTTFILM